MPRESVNVIKGLYPHTINELEDGLSTPPLPEFKPYRIIETLLELHAMTVLNIP